ncbi:MAG: pyridoxal phosphate-dependent decarboxylase family protein, partial [Candidatus Hodarchaeales archaeon]
MKSEETLDPENWDELRELSHKMTDDMLKYLETIREKPVWQDIPKIVKTIFESKIPEEGQNREKIYQEFIEYVLPYPLGNIHPRFWGWVYGTGTPFGVLAGILSSTLNSDTG